LDHVIIDVTLVSIVGILGLSGVILGLIWGNNKKNDPNFHKAKEETMQNQIKWYRDEVHRLNGSISKQRQKFQTDGDYDLDNDGDLASLAKSLLPQIVEFLPSSVQQHAKGLLNKPEVVDLLVEVHKQFPNEIKSLFGGFLKGNKPKTDGTLEVSSTSNSFSAGGA